jgi:hypothetical protein
MRRARLWPVLLLELLVTATGCHRRKHPPKPSESSPPVAEVPSTPISALPAEDRGFVDARNGWGWSDRCWKNLGANQLANAKAECMEGLKLAPEGASGARPSLLYNLGLIAERSGDVVGARALFVQSVELRPNAEVAAALTRVGGAVPRSTSSFACGAGRCNAGQFCCNDGRCAAAPQGPDCLRECDLQTSEPCVSSKTCKDNRWSPSLHGTGCE